MKIAMTYWRRILTSRLHLVFLLVVPIGLTVVIMTAAGGSGQIAVAWVDLDDSAFTRSLYEHMAPRARLITMEEEDAWPQLIQQKIQFAVILPQGLTEDILYGDPPVIRTRSIQDTNVSRPFALALDSALNSAVLIGQRAFGEEEIFHAGWNVYLEGRFAVERTSAEIRDTNASLASMGFLIMSMLFLSSFSTMYMVHDRQNRVVMRILLTPVSLRRYMVESIISFLAISVLQVLAVLAILHVVFGFYFGPQPQLLVLILLLFSLVSVALGVSISNFVPNARAASPIASLLITPMCMLGGCFWPRQVMPQFLQDVSQFVPTAWAMDGAVKVVNGASLANLQMEIVVLLLFASVFLLLGSWKKPDLIR